MGQIKLQSPLFDKLFLKISLSIAPFDPFEVIFDNLMNLYNFTTLVYDLFDDFNQVKKKFEQVQRNFDFGGF